MQPTPYQLRQLEELGAPGLVIGPRLALAKLTLKQLIALNDKWDETQPAQYWGALPAQDSAPLVDGEAHPFEVIIYMPADRYNAASSPEVRLDVARDGWSHLAPSTDVPAAWRKQLGPDALARAEVTYWLAGQPKHGDLRLGIGWVVPPERADEIEREFLAASEEARLPVVRRFPDLHYPGDAFIGFALASKPASQGAVSVPLERLVPPCVPILETVQKKSDYLDGRSFILGVCPPG